MRYLLIAAKLAATTGLLWLTFSGIDAAKLGDSVSAKQVAAALAAGLLVMSAHACVKAWRLQMCCRLVGQEISAGAAWVACQFAGFFSHTPASFLSGDAMRIWQMSRAGMKVPDAAKAVLLDRALGLLGLMVLVLASAPAIHSAASGRAAWWGFLVLNAIALAALLSFFVLGIFRPSSSSSAVLRWASDFATLSRYLAAQPRQALQVSLLAVFIAGLNVAAFWVVGAAYDANIGLAIVFAAGPIVSLTAMIPVSVAGWGLREGAFVVAFGLFGVAAETALTISVTFGIAYFMTYLPAPAIWFVERRQPSAGS